MQTVSGVKRNLWATRASGLLAPKRMNFPLDGLVFYAPLWHPELNTSPFISKELGGTSCTVVGATWGITGRTFDGDDYIKHTVANWRSSDSLGTILAWFKTSAACQLLSSADEATTTSLFNFTVSAVSHTLKVQQQNNNDTQDRLAGSTTVDDGVWHLGALVSSGTAYSMFVGSVNSPMSAESLTIESGANTGDWFADTCTVIRDNLAVGALLTSSPSYATGEISVVIGYSLARTLAELENIRLATRWRYV